MNTVIHPTYFPNIQIFKNMVNSKNLFFEINDNYVKQSFRNRTSIYTANGKLDMTIPVKFSSSKREKLKGKSREEGQRATKEKGEEGKGS